MHGTAAVCWWRLGSPGKCCRLGVPQLCCLLGSSEVFPYHCILLKANHPESSRELFRPRARSRDTQALLLSCLLCPSFTQAFPDLVRQEDGGDLSCLWLCRPHTDMNVDGNSCGKLLFALVLQQDSDTTARLWPHGCVGPEPLSPPRLILVKMGQKRIKTREMRTQPWHGTVKGHHVPAPHSHFIRAGNGTSST